MKLYYENKLSTSEQLASYIKEEANKYSELVIVCVGTAIHPKNRFDFDNIGPLIGTMLKKLNVDNVYGTLEEPIHYQNIQSFKSMLKLNYPDAFILAIDAATGFKKNIIRYIAQPLEAASSFKEPIIIGDHCLTITTTRGTTYESCIDNQISTEQMLNASLEICKIIKQIKCQNTNIKFYEKRSFIKSFL